MNILTLAEQITSGDRMNEYGHPSYSFDGIARMWSEVLGMDVSAKQVALCMITLKIKRFIHGDGLDSLVDIAGYARTLQMMKDSNGDFDSLAERSDA